MPLLFVSFLCVWECCCIEYSYVLGIRVIGMPF
jgi:hypothetical protein